MTSDRYFRVGHNVFIYNNSTRIITIIFVNSNLILKFMNKMPIQKVFGIVNAFDHISEAVRKELDARPCSTRELRLNHLEQEKVIRSMKRAANRMQLASAHKNALEFHRQKQIFYGLVEMIKTEVIGMIRHKDIEAGLGSKAVRCRKGSVH